MADNRSIYTEDGWVRAEAVTGYGAKAAAERLAEDLARRLNHAGVRVFEFIDKNGQPTGAYEIHVRADQRLVESMTSADKRPHGVSGAEGQKMLNEPQGQRIARLLSKRGLP